MRKIVLCAAAFLAATSTFAAERKPLVIDAGQTKQIPDADTLSVPKIDVKATSGGIKNMPGASQSVFYNHPGYAAELAHGTDAAPITAAGSSIKVSRTENIELATCGGVYNNNECNSAIYGISRGLASDKMQTNGILGVALGFQTTPGGPSSSGPDSVGVQGIGRIVGNGVNIGTGGYFEGRSDSPFGFTVGAEIRSNNLTGTDAVPNVTSGHGHIAIIASCGAGTFAENKCGSALQITNAGNIFNYGVVVTDGAAQDVAIYDASWATTSIKLTGQHTHIMETDSGFNISGGGKVWVGSNYNSATTYGVTVRQANGTQALFQSTGSNASVVNIENTTTGQQARLDFNNAGINTWQVGKNAANGFFVWDNGGSKDAISITSGASGVVTLGSVLRLPRYTVSALTSAITCNSGAEGVLASVTDANSATFNAALAGGGANRVMAYCNGTGWVVR